MCQYWLYLAFRFISWAITTLRESGFRFFLILFCLQGIVIKNLLTKVVVDACMFFNVYLCEYRNKHNTSAIFRVNS